MAAEAAQKKLTSELEKFQTLQKDYQKFVRVRQVLEGQLTENTLVKEYLTSNSQAARTEFQHKVTAIALVQHVLAEEQEMERLEASANVYKMIGPILVKQDLDESKQTVEKRIGYINGEMKRHDGAIKDLEKKQETQRELLQKLQMQYQQAQQKAVKA